MKRKSFLAIVALAVLSASCVQEDIAPVVNTAEVTAIMENDLETKTNVTETGYFTWTQGDKISIHTYGGLIRGCLTDGKDTPNGKFLYSYTTTTAPVLSGFAVYPYNAGHEINGNELTFVMPSTYDLGNNISNTNVAMLAVPTTKNASATFNFSHLAGAFRLVFNNAPAGTSKLEFSLGGQKINGTFAVNLAEPVISTSETEKAAEKMTTLNFTPLTETSDIVLFIPVPVGEYTGIKAVLYNKDGDELGEWGSETKVTTVNKRSLKLMSEINIGSAEGDIENNQYVATETQLAEAVVKGGKVTLSENITLKSALVIEGTPLAKSAASELKVTIDLNGKTLTSAGDGFEVRPGATLTLKGNGTVNAGTEGGNWVAVWANGGNVVIEDGTYNVVVGEEGSTNDCIYAKGSQITINGGTFSNAGTYVAGKGGVVINANNGDNGVELTGHIIINGGTFKPAEGCVPYETKDVETGRIELNNPAMNEEELRIAVSAGKDVKLGANMTVSSAIVVTKDLTVDLNGKTLTSAGDGFEVTAGTLTLKGNGTVNAGTEGGNWVAVWANGGNVVIEDGTYNVVVGEEGSTNDCIYAKGSQITINGGTFSNAGTYVAGKGGVVINANNGDNGVELTGHIIINGGTFKPAKGCVPYEQKDVDTGRVVVK